MTRVKHLIGLYESHPRDLPSQGPNLETPEREPEAGNSPPVGRRQFAVDVKSSSGRDTVSPPKFIPHPLLQSVQSPASVASRRAIEGLPLGISAGDITNRDQDLETASASLSSTPSIPDSTDSQTAFASGASYGSARSSERARVEGRSGHISNPLDIDHKETIFQYPPSLHVNSQLPRTSGVMNGPSAASIRHSSSFAYRSLSTAHKPVAATVVFSRNAAPLYLPHLDEQLAVLPAPSFPKFSSISAINGRNDHMFPPLQHLAALGTTLDDLEHNAQLPHWWRSRNKIVGALVSLAVSVTVCTVYFAHIYPDSPKGSSALTSFYSLHGLIDVLQIFALILNTVGKHFRPTDVVVTDLRL